MVVRDQGLNLVSILYYVIIISGIAHSGHRELSWKYTCVETSHVALSRHIVTAVSVTSNIGIGTVGGGSQGGHCFTHFATALTLSSMQLFRSIVVLCI